MSNGFQLDRIGLDWNGMVWNGIDRKARRNKRWFDVNEKVLGYVILCASCLSNATYFYIIQIFMVVRFIELIFNDFDAVFIVLTSKGHVD